MPTETRYFRSDTHTVNTYTIKKLGTAKSGTAGTEQVSWQSRVAQGAYVRTRVCVVKQDGTIIDVTTGAQVYLPANTTAVLNATIDVPNTTLDETDAILVEIQYSVDGTTWTGLSSTVLGADWITEQLNTTVLNSATWTVYYDLQVYSVYSPFLRRYTNYLSFRYDGDYQSRIENFTYGITVVTHKLARHGTNIQIRPHAIVLIKRNDEIIGYRKPHAPFRPERPIQPEVST